MSGKLSGHIQALHRHKAELIDILSGDADFVLQHAQSRLLVSRQGYGKIKACRIPSEKVRDLLDHVISRGPGKAQGLLELLKAKELQEEFPRLEFINNIQVNTQPSEKEKSRKRKRKRAMDVEDTIPSKQAYNSSSPLVTEKQLMTVARAIGQFWRQIAVLALEIPSVKLEQITADNSLHVDRVFEMLRYWRNCQNDKATAAYLHSLLSHKDLELPMESIACLLETNQ